MNIFVYRFHENSHTRFENPRQKQQKGEVIQWGGGGGMNRQGGERMLELTIYIRASNKPDNDYQHAVTSAAEVTVMTMLTKGECLSPTSPPRK